MERIIGIGIDEVEKERVLRACENTHFLKRCFSDREQFLIEKRKTRAATNFAGKEAVLKAFGTGFGKISPTEVEVLRKENGAPYICLSGKAKQYALENGIRKVHISLTDTQKYAAAYAIVTGEAKENEEA